VKLSWKNVKNVYKDEKIIKNEKREEKSVVPLKSCFVFSVCMFKRCRCILQQRIDKLSSRVVKTTDLFLKFDQSV